MSEETEHVCEFGFPGPFRDRLVAAVLSGEKTATSSLLVEYEADEEPLPVPGERQTVIDSAGQPVGVIEVVAIDVIRLGDADLRLAIEEGEDYDTVAGWRAEHERFWNDEVLPTLSPDRVAALTDDTQVVVQRFRLVTPGRFDEPSSPSLAQRRRWRSAPGSAKSPATRSSSARQPSSRA